MLKRFTHAIVGVSLALASSFASAQSSWTAYLPKNDAAMPKMSQADAADTFFAIMKQKAVPANNGRCWRYYWNAGISGQATDAKWTNGQLTQGCSWPQAGVGSTADNTGGIAVGISCSDTAADERCTVSKSPAIGKNAGNSCDRIAGQLHCGNPINVSTTNKYQIEADFQIPGSPWLGFNRYYNSQANRARGAAMGYRWRHSFDYELHFASDGAAVLYRPDGSTRTFGGSTNQGPEFQGFLSPVFDVNAQLTGYQFDDGEGQVETYTAYGTITKIDFKAGGFVSFVYGTNPIRPAQVVDHFGRTLTFGYDSSYRVTSITTPAGAIYTYTYDTNDRLTTRVAPGSFTRTYGYDVTSQSPTTYQRGMLTSITDETSVVVGRYTYDSKGRALSTESAAGVNKFSVSYGSTSTSVTSALGAVTQNVFSNVLGTPRLTSTTTTCPSGTCAAINGTASTYDSNGNMTSHLSADGVRSCMAYDIARNLATKEVGGLAASADCASILAGAVASPASVTTVVWHATMRRPETVAAPKQRRTFAYDAAGRLTSTSVIATVDQTGSLGPSAATVGAVRTENYTYNEFGQLTSHTGPRSDAPQTTTYSYGTAGVLTSVTNPAGQVVLYSDQDADGRARMITLPNGAIVQLAYDPRGLLTSSTTAGETTTYAYYPNGSISSITLPSGEAESYVYDGAGRVTKVTDQRGNTRNFVYNLAGGATSEQTKNSTSVLLASTTRVFDALNRVTKMAGAHAVDPQLAPYTP